MLNRLERLINHFSRLPGIGRKSASRIAYWILEADRGFVETLSADLKQIQQYIVRCRSCGNYAESTLCEICTDSGRDTDTLCVVEQARDLSLIEFTGEYKGIYHVLHGVLSPLDGVGPEELGFNRLHQRVTDHGVKEVIVATNPTIEGDSTALYIVKMLSGQDIKVTRIASGLPVGGDMEYADKQSISRALRARQNLG